MAQAAVILNNVVKRFGSVEAVSGVSLEVNQGEFVAFIGPSGCGKTTTLRLVAGLEQPSSGTISINGRCMTNAKPWERDTPMVWQNFALFPFLNVRRNVEFGLRERKIDKKKRQEKVSRALEIVGVPELGERQISELSGGQKQRVGIARALVTDPKVLLLDEPLGSLDANLRVRMQSELRALQRKLGITFIYVTHNQSEAFAMADRIVVMHQGRIHQIGSPHEVYRQPSDKFVAEFVGVNNIFSGQVSEFDKKGPVVSTGNGPFLISIPNEEKVTIGDHVTFLISADRVTTSYEGELEENQVTGAVKGQEFVGTIVTLLLELKDGTTFRIQKQERQMLQIPTKLGDNLTVSWNPNDAYVLPTS